MTKTHLKVKFRVSWNTFRIGLQTKRSLCYK